MKVLFIALILFLNIPIYKKILDLMFVSMDDFYEAIRYAFTPDIFSFFKGKYIKDQFYEMRFNFFILVCAVVIFVEYIVINKVFNLLGIYL